MYNVNAQASFISDATCACPVLVQFLSIIREWSKLIDNHKMVMLLFKSPKHYNLYLKEITLLCLKISLRVKGALIHRRKVWFLVDWTRLEIRLPQGSWLEWVFYWPHPDALAATEGLSLRADYAYRSCPCANLSPFGKHLQHVSVAGDE